MNVEDALYPLLSVYERMPQGLKSGLGWTYRQLPASWRLGAGYGQFRQLARDCEQWPVARAEAYQLEQLRAVLTHANDHSPLYRRRFAEAGFRPEQVTSLDAMGPCPYLAKEDLVERLDDLVCDEPAKTARLYMTTGGSTGSPVGFYLHKGISRPKEQAFLEAQWSRGGYFDGARLVVVRGQVTSERAQGRLSSYDATRDWLMLSSYHLTEERLDEYLSLVKQFKPDVLHAYPSAALQLAELMERAGKRWPVPLKCLLAGSERLTSPQKRLLEATFGCRIFTWYGHSERAVLAAEGYGSELLYFWPSYGYVEFGPPDDNGLQEVIATSFHNLVLPLVRYRTGDYVRVHYDASDKEFPWPAVEKVEGREQEFLVTATGRRISLTAFNMHDTSFDDVYALQFCQVEPGVAELRYVAGPNFDPARVAVIEAVLKRKLGDDLAVSLKRVDAVEKTARGKSRWLVTSRA